MNENRLVNGYLFDSDEDAKKAKKEFNNINIIKSQIDSNNPEELFNLYNKLVSKRIFETPIGISFLHELRSHLIEDLFYLEEDVPIIKLNLNAKYINKVNENVKLKVANEKLTLLRNKLIIISVALIITVVGMLILAATNKNVGYFNTEEKILNKYSVWQEQLEIKEQELNDREEMLNNQQLDNQ